MLMTRTQDLLIMSRSARLSEINSRLEGVFMLEVREYTKSTSRLPREGSEVIRTCAYMKLNNIGQSVLETSTHISSARMVLTNILVI